MKSFIAKPAEVERKWYVVDAEGKTLGRLASEVASILRGKKKPIYTPHVDCGDYVIVINADKVKFTGKKMDQKIYYNHSDYVGGMRETTLREMMAKKLLTHAGLCNIIFHVAVSVTDTLIRQQAEVQLS